MEVSSKWEDFCERLPPFERCPSSKPQIKLGALFAIFLWCKFRKPKDTYLAIITGNNLSEDIQLDICLGKIAATHV